LKRKQFSPYLIFGIISLLLVGALFAYLFLMRKEEMLLSYIVAINSVTFLLYGFDKFASAREMLRVPERMLHGLALFGGSPAALLAQKFFRHKTIKGSFQLVYWAIVILQVSLIWFYMKG
jgi:uncharacterized membrane protein YsdA (DUF1294 family)